MYAVRWIQTDALAVGLARVVDHFVDVGWTEILARAAVFLHALCIADIRIVDDEMRRLVLFVLRAGVIKIGQLVEREFAIPFCGAEQMGFGTAVRGEIGELLHMRVSSFCGITIAQAAAAGNHLQSGVEHAGKHTVFEPLMQVANFPELLLDPAGFDFLLELAEHRGGRIIFLPARRMPSRPRAFRS